jgi:hypothetical protein
MGLRHGLLLGNGHTTQRPEGLAGPDVDKRSRGVRACRQGSQDGEPAPLASMERVAPGLSGAAQVVRHGGRRLALGTGEEAVTATPRKGGRRPETGLQRGPLVRRERAYQ